MQSFQPKTKILNKLFEIKEVKYRTIIENCNYQQLDIQIQQQLYTFLELNPFENPDLKRIKVRIKMPKKIYSCKLNTVSFDECL